MKSSLTFMGSYHPSDVVFLLKDLSDITIEKSNIEREKAIQEGIHYSEMLPIEYKPSDQYMKLFYQSLYKGKQRVAIAVGVVAERILRSRGQKIVLCSLARAGTPVGILIKRYIEYKYKVSLPHYSVSIIRGRGIDAKALGFILDHHPEETVVFVDGWTGKGAITKELHLAIEEFNGNNGTHLSSELAVLADPGDCSNFYGTREDFLIPSACLNSTVSGLVSRTIFNDRWIGPDDFHGAKYYKELIPEDVSIVYIDIITSQFPLIEEQVHAKLKEPIKLAKWQGLTSITAIQQSFAIDNTHFIKPGVGETTRVLLRRIPWKILINPSLKNTDNLDHIMLLAKDRQVSVEAFQHMSYSCCGLIKSMEKPV